MGIFESASSGPWHPRHRQRLLDKKQFVDSLGHLNDECQARGRSTDSITENGHVGNLGVTIDDERRAYKLANFRHSFRQPQDVMNTISLAASESISGAMESNGFQQASSAAVLREQFGDRPPEITRKITACVACRKQKIKCHMRDGPPCARCKKRGLSCTVNKSLQMILESDADWKGKFQGKSYSYQVPVLTSNVVSSILSLTYYADIIGGRSL
jgi:hypothetical protein